MARLLHTVAILLLYSNIYCYAQINLVPNYSFEDSIKCPSWNDEFNGYIANWTGQGSEPGGDLCWFTGECSGAGGTGVPLNIFGYRQAHSGISYAGICAYFDTMYAKKTLGYNFRNYIQVKLNSILVTGEVFCVQFFVSLADTCKYACNDMGAYFSDSLIYEDPSCRVKSYLTPQIANNPISTPLTDKVNWIRIAGCFIAKGGEHYIVIGNFKDDTSSSIDSVGSQTGVGSWDAEEAYYYVDDISVREIIHASASTFKKDTEICIGESVLIGDTAVPGVSYSWQPITGLANPNAAQTFASPIVTTTYTLTVKNDSIRGCACADSISTDTVTIHICPPPPPLEDNIFIPSAFSPNGDGQNDILLPKGNNVATLYMAIFDRWGNKVFESENINEGWDGNYKGKPCETATYSYYANGSYEDGKMFSTKGNVTLVR